MNYNQLGIAFLQSGQNEGALNAFRRVTEIEPERAALFCEFIKVGDDVLVGRFKLAM